MNNKSKKLAAAAAAVLLSFSFAACSDDSGSGEAISAEEQKSLDVAEDLEKARDTVIEALDYGEWDQVMLASDVDGPTQKYGLLVMPFIKSDAAEHVTGTVRLYGEDFTIDAKSASTGQVWRIDQDGNISEVDEEDAE